MTSVNSPFKHCLRIFAVVSAFYLFAIPVSAKPKLVVVIVIDQMRADYLTRFQDLYGEGGFKRLMNDGAYFTNCKYTYSETQTGPGHATILSGLPPRFSGIIANDWYVPSLGHTIYCVSDSSVRSVGTDPAGSGGRMSPRNFLGTSLADQLLSASPSSKCIGIALKDRAAILPVGKHPTAAYWFDEDNGIWVTSTYYRQALPTWVQVFNGRKLPEQSFGKVWAKLLPDSAYARQGKDDAAGEDDFPGQKKSVFPYTIRDLAGDKSDQRFYAFVSSPFGLEHTAAFAETSIVAEQLGKRDATDLLSVSFSSTDWIGHTFGPDSYEIEDMYL
ncbi:MAG TPA: alkaline phosphatase family protein, partial [Bacteroidota bacterium]|nr:alkaline phosphatase family protein [Bacteroidota bacterium]